MLSPAAGEVDQRRPNQAHPRRNGVRMSIGVYRREDRREDRRDNRYDRREGRRY